MARLAPGIVAEEALQELSAFLATHLHRDPRESYFLALDLLCGVLDLQRSTWLIHSHERLITDAESAAIEQAVERLLHHEPLQYILGEAPFGQLMLEVGSGVLIPRPETEELCQKLSDRLARQGKQTVTFLDLGAGSGAITLTLAQGLSGSRGFALEKSPQALHFLRRNVDRYRQSVFPSRVEIIEGDMLDGSSFANRLPPLDALVSNPPYICQEERPTLERHVIDFEPEEALFAPASDPLYFYRAIARLCRQLPFAPVATLFLEVNSALAQETAALFASDSLFEGVEVLNDFTHRPRFICARISPAQE